MGLQARYQVYVNDTALATEIEQYMDNNDKATSEAFREAIVEKMERDGHFDHSGREPEDTGEADGVLREALGDDVVDSIEDDYEEKYGEEDDS